MLPNDIITQTVPRVVAWRHRIHQKPELGFEEHETAAFVAERLRSFGLEVHEGIGGTGVVGALRRRTGSRAIALRAELDALPIVEKTDKPYASARPGVMHACGHDGHTAILLGAAKILAEDGDFDGCVNFIFQPAEEFKGGGLEMIADGLLERFPVEHIFALHNWPDLPFGTIATWPGPIMAAVDNFELKLMGVGAHAAMPHLGDDPILAATEFVGAVQRIVSRAVDPQVPVVVSITQIHAGTVGNIVPPEVWLQGTCRFFDPSLSNKCETLIKQIAEGVAASHGIRVALEYQRGYPPVINTPKAAAISLDAARKVVGEDKVLTDLDPSMGCEDFAYLAQAADGVYTWIGAGEARPGEGLHGDRYDFNDGVVPICLQYWRTLVEQVLSSEKGA